jgi:predicted Rossmann fold nucleotide-binding protein DprA/Smf involved in DNA uptake
MWKRMARTDLEERLEAITRQFVREIVLALRSASFADVAQLQVTASASARPRGRPPTRVSATPARPAPTSERKPVRQNADRRAELGERVLKVLEGKDPLGVRALSSELGVAPDLLTAPLLELRAAGRIAKHGEKRATTYSLA